MNTLQKTCYMCDEISTSAEHAPPRSLFPKMDKYRKNLIKVPSCNIHNENQSHADEILFQLLMSYPIKANEPHSILHRQFINRNSANFKRKINTFANQIENLSPAIIIDQLTGEKEEVGLIKLESSANIIYNSLEKLGCALYFHENGKKLSAPFFVNLAILVQDEDTSQTRKSLYELTEKLAELFSISFKGDNPEIFQYRILEYQEGASDVIIEFLFYEQIKGIFKCILNK